jgi:hypothetical protein
MKDLARYIDENKLAADEKEKVLSIQASLIAWPKELPFIATPNRRIVTQGNLVVNKQKMRAVLFNDSLLYCKPKPEGKLKYKGFIMLGTSRLNLNIGDGIDFEIISNSGKDLFSIPEDREIWLRNISETVELAHNDLLDTAFLISCGITQRVGADLMTKRSEKVVLMVQTEKTHVHKIKTIVDVFFRPLKEAAESSYPVIPKDSMNKLFGNIDKICITHSRFLQSLEEVVCKWTQDSTVGNLFNNHLSSCDSLYLSYVANYHNAVAILEENSKSINWMTFLVQKEAECKESLASLLEYPLKIVSQYYLQLEELMKLTPPDHLDYKHLQVVNARVKEQLNTHKSQGHSMKRRTPRKPSIDTVFDIMDCKVDTKRLNKCSSRG